MRIVVRNTRLDPERLQGLLNRLLNPYNIHVLVEETPGRGYQELRVTPSLIKPVKYSPLYSQRYSREAEHIDPRTLMEKPLTRFGVKRKTLHYYHWALLIDTLTYILDRLGADYVIETSLGSFRGWRSWRRSINIEYRPSLDPAFVKRDSRLVERYKGLPIYRDRAKMLSHVDRVDELLETGVLRPSDIPVVEEKILRHTRASDKYRDADPSSPESYPPHIRAWITVFRSEVAPLFSLLDEEGRKKLADKVHEWLRTVDPRSPEFKRYLEEWKEEMKADIWWAIEKHGPFAEKHVEKDDAGFPYQLAEKLLTTPFNPGIPDTEIVKLRRDTVEEEELLA